MKEECGDIKNMIFEYLSGELTEEEVKIFEKHILTCDECRAELDFSKELDGFLDNIACEPPEELKGRVISTVKRDRRLKLFYRISKAALPAAAMIAIIFLLCGYPRTAKMNSPAEDEGTILEDNYCDAEMPSDAENEFISGDKYPDIWFFFTEEGFLLGCEEEISDSHVSDKETSGDETSSNTDEAISKNENFSTSAAESPEASAPAEEPTTDIEIPGIDDDLIQHFYLEIYLVKSYLMVHKLPDGMGRPVTVYHYQEYDIHIYEYGSDFLPDNMTELYETGEYSLIIVKNGA